MIDALMNTFGLMGTIQWFITMGAIILGFVALIIFIIYINK